MFKYSGSITSVKNACIISNKQAAIDYVCFTVENSKPFDMSSAENKYIADKLRNFLKQINISVIVYKPKWRWSKALGYFTYSEPTNIYLNQYKLNRSVASLVGTFYHELVHMVDYFDNMHSYNHGDNSPIGKANTAPYKIGNIAVGYVNHGVDDFNSVETGKIKLKTAWYLKFKLTRFIYKLFN